MSAANWTDLTIAVIAALGGLTAWLRAQAAAKRAESAHTRINALVASKAAPPKP